LSAIDDHGHEVIDLISKMDRRWPDDFRLERIRGYASEHTLTMKLADVAEPRIVLVMTGWTDYAWSSDNVAAAQAKKEMTPPSLQVKDAKGGWRTVIEDIGIPVGRPQTVTVDLTEKFLSADRECHLPACASIGDQILVDTGWKIAVEVTGRSHPRCLRFEEFLGRGNATAASHSATIIAASRLSPWKVMTGRYTPRAMCGNCFFKKHDMFVISRPGDEIESFVPGRLAGACPR
jgi:hypothetical protein